ncbi:methyltransferase, FkbM family [Haladaptatus litoreus]|uniref:Methyltransferase, FkbM family n=1 Tax=Haladaptatus litoreus TaxID=553468 RepID=A0A1N7DNA7_9EURY|nr:FkbM family methyltransferase [Haladaptatus litoreus]SIR77218.1 methyltransferase, FkbM family [Haladaptatus litoreus]
MVDLEHRATRSYLWNFCKRVGVAPVIATLYWHTKLALHFWSTTVTIGCHTVKFATDTRTEYQRATSLVGEQTVIESLLTDVRDSDIVFDIGANIGTHTCFVGKSLRSGRVIAFEPMPTNAIRLRHNLSMNLPASRWEVAELALSNEEGSGTLAVEGKRYGEGKHALSSDGELTVDVSRGESLIEEGRYPAPDILKIDVEGAELRVLEGFGEQLSNVRVIYVELHYDLSAEYGTSTAEIETYLRDYGFEIERLSDRSDAYHIRAIRSQE